MKDDEMLKKDYGGNKKKGYSKYYIPFYKK